MRRPNSRTGLLGPGSNNFQAHTTTQSIRLIRLDPGFGIVLWTGISEMNLGLIRQTDKSKEIAPGEAGSPIPRAGDSTPYLHACGPFGEHAPRMRPVVKL